MCVPVLLWGLDPVQLLSHGGPHCTVPWALTPTSPAHCLPAGLILPQTRRASLLVAPSALSIDAGGRGHTVGMEKGDDLRVVSFPVTSESSPKPLLSALVYSVANWPADGAGFQLWPAAGPASVGHRALAPWGPGAGASSGILLGLFQNKVSVPQHFSPPVEKVICQVLSPGTSLNATNTEAGFSPGQG